MTRVCGDLQVKQMRDESGNRFLYIYDGDNTRYPTLILTGAEIHALAKYLVDMSTGMAFEEGCSSKKRRKQWIKKREKNW